MNNMSKFDERGVRALKMAPEKTAMRFVCVYDLESGSFNLYIPFNILVILWKYFSEMKFRLTCREHTEIENGRTDVLKHEMYDQKARYVPKSIFYLVL